MNLIERAEMHNFRGYGDKNNVIEFKPGVNLVLGDNATGKSTIIALLQFNLLNKKVEVSRFEDYRTIEPVDLGGFKSRLSVRGVDSKEYTFEKEYKGKGSVKDRIFIEREEQKRFGQWEFNRTKDVQDFIHDKFGARKEILEDIIIQTQDPQRLLWPVSDSKTVGKELARLLRVEELQYIYTNAKSCENLLNGKTAMWLQEKQKADSQIQALKLKSPDEYMGQKKQLESSKGLLAKRSTELERQKTSKKAKRKEIDKNVRALDKSSGELERVEKQADELSRELKDATKPKSSMSALGKSKEKIESERDELQEQLGEVNEKIGGAKSAVTAAEAVIQRYKPVQEAASKEYGKLATVLKGLGISQPPNTQKALDKLLKTAQGTTREIAAQEGGLKAQITSENKYKGIISGADAKCPVCESEITPEARKKILSQKTQLIAELKKRVAANKQLASASDSLREALDKFEQCMKRGRDAADRLSEAEKAIANAGKDSPRLEREKARLNSRIEALKEKISVIEAKIDLLEQFDQLAEYYGEGKKLRKKVLLLPKARSQLEKADAEIDKLDGKIKEVDAKLAALQPRIDALAEKANEAKYWYGELDKNQTNADVTQEFTDEVRLASEAARLSLHESFTNYCDMISSNIGWIWPRLYDRPDLKRVELQTSITDTTEGDNMVISTEVQLVRVDSKGGRLPFTTISSHGQRVLASIAFRVAFLNLIAKSNVPKVLVLDEPTIWVDEKNREKLGRVLGGLVREIKEGGVKIDQVIVVSHDSSFLNAIDPEAVKHQCIKNDEGFCEISAIV